MYRCIVLAAVAQGSHPTCVNQLHDWQYPSWLAYIKPWQLKLANSSSTQASLFWPNLDFPAPMNQLHNAPSPTNRWHHKNYVHILCSHCVTPSFVSSMVSDIYRNEKRLAATESTINMCRSQLICFGCLSHCRLRENTQAHSVLQFP